MMTMMCGRVMVRFFLALILVVLMPTTVLAQPSWGDWLSARFAEFSDTVYAGGIHVTGAIDAHNKFWQSLGFPSEADYFTWAGTVGAESLARVTLQQRGARLVIIPAPLPDPGTAISFAPLVLGAGPVVVLGDSISAYPNVGADRPYAHYLAPIVRTSQVVNLAVGGSTTYEMLQRWPLVLAASPSAVIVQGGTNDITWDVPLAQTVANLTELAQLARGANIPFVLIGGFAANRGSAVEQAKVLPMRAAIRLMAETERLRFYVDVLSQLEDRAVAGQGSLAPWLSQDGIHLNDEGQQIVARRIRQAVFGE